MSRRAGAPGTGARRNRRRRAGTALGWVLAFVAVAFSSGCARAAVNPPLKKLDPGYGYRFANLRSPGNSDELFVVLVPSGGGTRSAALSYGVMEKLRDTTVVVNGERRSLLQEVDVIAATSTGGVLGAFYAAFGDKLFTDFEERFLKRNIQGVLLGKVLSPLSWGRLASGTFDRSDLAGEFYDREVFENRTFGDLAKRGRRPFLILMAADMTLRAPFVFTQEQFDGLRSDLSGVTLGRALAAISAFVPIFSPVRLVNYNKAPWARPGCQTPAGCPMCLAVQRLLRPRPRRFARGRKPRPYVMLIDGGTVCNLAVAPVLDALTRRDGDWSLLRLLDEGKVKHVAIIVVNARVDTYLRQIGEVVC